MTAFVRSFVCSFVSSFVRSFVAFCYVNASLFARWQQAMCVAPCIALVSKIHHCLTLHIVDIIYQKITESVIDFRADQAFSKPTCLK